MDFQDTSEEAAFRAEARAWLDANAKPKVDAEQRISVMGGYRDDPASVVEAKRWQATLAEAGWAAIHWPVAHGGRDASALESTILFEELAHYDVPDTLFAIGIAMIGPTLIAHASDAQKARYLEPMRRGDEIWCQLWSEPDAGSDLASLQTRAERDGDELVLNGQKVWTSGAHYCDYGLGIFRTDLDEPKHKGISCCIVDLRTPGVTIRPLRQMTGAAHFNEVFFDDARIPLANLVGDWNDGWRVARTTLMNERFATGSLGSSVSTFEALVDLARTPRADGTRAADDPLVRQRLARVFSLGRIFDLTSARVRTSLSKGAIPGVEGSILKLAIAQLGTAVADLGVDVAGAGGMLLGDEGAPEGGRWSDALLGSFAMHIGGGTDEVQRNIVGELVLGLPREADASRELPFRDLARRAPG
jgi:alkylation response protein AidB-like acyl-CoA dehydrogenase